MPKYLVATQSHYVEVVEVEAENEDEARTLAADGLGEVVRQDWVSYIGNSGDWSVEAKKE